MCVCVCVLQVRAVAEAMMAEVRSEVEEVSHLQAAEVRVIHTHTHTHTQPPGPSLGEQCNIQRRDVCSRTV